MPKTLLLADDSVTIQKVVGLSFASEDIEITTVDNGNAAVAKARELRPDVILADVVMPGLNGYEVCEAIKADPDLRHIPVVLLTGTFEAFDEERASRAGAAGHVAKPFEAQTLVDRVRALLAAPPPVPPAARAEVLSAPVPSSPSAGDGAFDFFSDSDAGAEPLEFDESDAAFAFGDDDLSASTQEPRPSAPLQNAPAAPATVAILPERSWSAPASGDAAFDRVFESAGGQGGRSREGAQPSEGGPLQRTAEEPVSEADLAYATLLDPAAGSGFDVSSSDLELETEVGEPPGDFEASSLPPDPVLELLRPEPLEDSDPMAHAARPFGVELDPDDTASRSWPQYEPEPAEEAATLSPALREELHETLEKIAWDAFGQVTEKVVQQAIARIEQVAWEVVPKLAEVLIQEEIRRLKGEDPAE